MDEQVRKPMNRRQRRAASAPHPSIPEVPVAASHPVDVLMRRRNQLVLAAVLGALGFLVFGVVLSVGLRNQGRSWVGGPEFVTDVTIMSAMAALGVVTGAAAARQSHRIRSFAKSTWLSEEEGSVLEAETRRLRTLSRNAGLFAAFWATTFVLAVTSLVPGIGTFNGVQAGLHILAALVALFAVPLSLAAMRRWARRFRAVRETGWHAAKSVIVRRPTGAPLELAMITVEFDDGSTIELRTVESIYRAAHKEGQRQLEAWVGGKADAMVVLFEHGPLRQGAYPVPAAAFGGRTFPT